MQVIIWVLGYRLKVSLADYSVLIYSFLSIYLVNIADGKVILVLDDIKYFTPHKKGITWDEAVKACQQTQGANLVNINTQRVQDALKNELLILSENYHYWTAGYWNGKLTFSWNKGIRNIKSMSNIDRNDTHSSILTRCKYVNHQRMITILLMISFIMEPRC